MSIDLVATKKECFAFYALKIFATVVPNTIQGLLQATQIVVKSKGKNFWGVLFDTLYFL